MDAQCHYLCDSHGRQIKLHSSHIDKLRKEGLLKPTPSNSSNCNPFKPAPVKNVFKEAITYIRLEQSGKENRIDRLVTL